MAHYAPDFGYTYGQEYAVRTARTHVTVEEFEKLPRHEGVYLELTQGELIQRTPGRLRHNRVRDKIAFSLRQFVEVNRLGEIVIETEFQLSPDTVRIPDAAFVTAEHIQQVDPDRPLTVPPALVIEVVSPTDLAADLLKKVEQYLAAGAFSVWVIYPNVREAHVFQKNQQPRVLREPESLTEETLLPGFTITLATVFG